MTFSPLAGTKVLDFSWNVAGPTSTKVLAALGADVIKVEWPTRADPIRARDSLGFPGRRLRLAPASSATSTPASAASPPTRRPRRATDHRQALAWCDVIVESYSPRVMAGWGWTFQRMSELNPRLIYLSISGFGHTGPESSYVSYGPTAQAASGVTAASGEPGLAPAGYGFSYLDVMTGYQAALSVDRRAPAAADGALGAAPRRLAGRSRRGPDRPGPARLQPQRHRAGRRPVPARQPGALAPEHDRRLPVRDRRAVQPVSHERRRPRLLLRHLGHD